MTINNNTLKSDVFDAIRGLLANADLAVTDGGNIRKASVLASFNDKSPSKPMVVINPASVGEDTWKFGGTEGKKSINVSIEAWYGNTLGVDQLDDQICTLLKQDNIPGISLIGINSDYAFNAPGNQKWHLKTISVGYDRE
jgi:hypothetical protein